MSLFNRIVTWSASQLLKSSDLNGEFNNLVNGLNNLDGATTSWTNVKAATINATTALQVNGVTLPYTAWASYTPTFAGFGTVTNVEIFWRQVGDTVFIAGSFRCGTVAASAASMTIPAGKTIDTTKIPTGVASTAISGTYYWDSGSAWATANGIGAIFSDGSTAGTLFFCATPGTTALTKTNGSSVAASSNAVQVQCSIPVQ